MTPEQMQQIAADKAKEKYSKAIHKVCYYSGFLDGLTYSKWIAVEDGKKIDDGDYIVTIEYIGIQNSLKGKRQTVRVWRKNGRWLTEAHWPVIAYQPLPEPYKK